MATKDTYAGLPNTLKFGGKKFELHSRYSTKTSAEREAHYLRKIGTKRWKYVRIVPIEKYKIGYKYAIYVR